MSEKHADPLSCPRGNCTTFAVHIYNADVRQRVKENRPHHTISERWAVPQAHEVVAQDASEARRLAELRFPPQQGFVISAVERTH